MAVVDYTTYLRAALWAEVGAGCPSVLPANGGGGIVRIRRARRTPLATLVNDFGLPYAVVDLGPPANSPRAPADESLYRHRAEIYVVCSGGEDEEALWALLGPLRMRFEAEIAAHNMAVGQVVEVLGMDTTWYLPPQAMAVEKQLDVCCGRLSLLIDACSVVST